MLKRLVKVVVGALLIMGVCTGVAFANGSQESTADGENSEYAIMLKTLANPFWVTMKEGIEAEAEKMGVTVDIYAVQSESDLQGQLQMFETMLSKGYKGIGFAPLSPVNLVPAVAKAYKDGIKLVNIDEKINMEELNAAGGNVNAFVTTDNVAVGAKGGQFIVDQIGSGNVAIIEGKAGAASGEARRAGAAQIFESTSGINLVASQPADWDRSRALDVAANMIQRFSDLKGIYCANDTMALGAMQAVANAGGSDSIIVVGTDGIDEARDMVSQGKLGATVGQDPAEVGAESLRQLIAAVKNDKTTAVGDEPTFIAVDSMLIK